MENNTGFFEVTPGNKSFVRLNIAWYFWTICAPCSLALIGVFCYLIVKCQVIDLFVMITLIVLFLLLQAGWIAPKTLAKIAEESGTLTKELVNKSKV